MFHRGNCYNRCHCSPCGCTQERCCQEEAACGCGCCRGRQGRRICRRRCRRCGRTIVYEAAYRCRSRW